MLKAASVRRAAVAPIDAAVSFSIVLAHDERHLRRRSIALQDGTKILVDLAAPTVLNPGDALVLSDGRTVMIGAAEEELYRITGTTQVHLIELAWHIGNRHLAAEIRSDRIMILRDHVLKTMLEGLGAKVEELSGPFLPTRGAYAEQGQTHHHHSAPNSDRMDTHR